MKIVSSILFIVILYILPLSAEPALLLHPKLWVMMVFLIVLVGTQPSLSLKEAKETKSTDHKSVYYILVGAALSQLSAIVEWAYFRQPIPSVGGTTLSIVGVVLMVGGMGFRIWSIRTLGRFFTATVQVQRNQRIVTSGPYAAVRHPSYLGAYSAIVGSAIFMGSIISVMASILAMGYAYYVRISAEEETLAGTFGEEYRIYQQHSSRLIPRIW
jgi:protein-S-isoprenylcysteine O-methyltransferase Ste14